MLAVLVAELASAKHNFGGGSALTILVLVSMLIQMFKNWSIHFQLVAG